MLLSAITGIKESMSLLLGKIWIVACSLASCVTISNILTGKTIQETLLAFLSMFDFPSWLVVAYVGRHIYHRLFGENVKSKYILNEALENLANLRQQYLKNRWIFIPGDEMKGLVLALGATEEDLHALKTEGENLAQDPTLPFRKSRNGRYCFVPAKREIYRTVQQPFVLSTEEDFIRHDSGMIRQFAGLPSSTQENPIFQALLTINALIVEGSYVEPRSGLDYTSTNWVTTAFHLRTTTTPELLGEPALEGVHQDGVDHTMTIFLGAGNMRHGSAVTHLHSNEEISGIPWNQQNPQHILGSVQHETPLDTLIVVDHERKHSVSSVIPVDPSMPATRDMLIFFTRKPVEETHISHEYDSIEINNQDPLVLPLPESISV